MNVLLIASVAIGVSGAIQPERTDVNEAIAWTNDSEVKVGDRVVLYGETCAYVAFPQNDVFQDGNECETTRLGEGTVRELRADSFAAITPDSDVGLAASEVMMFSGWARAYGDHGVAFPQDDIFLDRTDRSASDVSTRVIVSSSQDTAFPQDDIFLP